MLTIRHDEGLPMPVITCDHCGTSITDARDGNYEWLPDDDGNATGQLHFTHKRCFHRFETQQRDGSTWLAMDLDTLPYLLLVALSLRYEQSKRRARLFWPF
jgi:hypothetical protein